MEIRKDSIIEIFKRYNAILEGHFLLSSGLHSDKYLQCALVLQYPDIAEKIAMLLFEEVKQKCVLWDRIDTVVSVAIGGIVIAQEFARVIKTFTGNNVRAIFAERDNYGDLLFRRGFVINPNDNIAVIEDVVTTGKSTNEVISLVKKNCSNIIVLASIFNRSSENQQENLFADIPYCYIAKIKVDNFNPQDCPLCKKNIPLVKPGSRPQLKYGL